MRAIWDCSKFHFLELEKSEVEEGMTMKKIAFVLSIIFTVLTFVGAVYVLINHGQVNAGYACIPMVLAIASHVGYKVKK